MTTRITIVRHGNTFLPNEVPRRIGRSTDIPLVEKGRQQARALADFFRSEHIRFDQVLVSPLQRTRETAALIIGDYHQSPPIMNCEWLAEVDHGPDENQSEETIIARIGTTALAAWEKQGVPPPGWRVDREGRLTAWRARFAAAATEDARNILVVTSNGAARFALMATDSLWEQARSLPSLKLRTGAWGRIVVSDGNVSLEAWNQLPA